MWEWIESTISDISHIESIAVTNRSHNRIESFFLDLTDRFFAGAGLNAEPGTDQSGIDHGSKA